jgi:hypothetical protein
LIDSKGSIVQKWEGALKGDSQSLVQLKIRPDIAKGAYVLRLQSGELQGQFKVVK